jgi:hypothetical protein
MIKIKKRSEDADYEISLMSFKKIEIINLVLLLVSIDS